MDRIRSVRILCQFLYISLLFWHANNMPCPHGNTLLRCVYL